MEPILLELVENLTKYGSYGFPYQLMKPSLTTYQIFNRLALYSTLITTFWSSRGASFNLEPQRSLGVATEHQTGLLEEVEFRIYLLLTTSLKKWQDAQPNLKEDDIILIKEEGPPGTWPMARVLQVHPGNDGLVRVATVKTQNSVLKRPVHKLHKFPIYPN
ncbi:DUF1759 domain-containing protein [Trichonephila clavipes]|uniref:DUF1759 domain-containing protein n=1 Tax=Trichonephila clavipes TaxID=2585209 RepID=A0A8X6WHJ5_TRICX|nr:DUF1759 domain-containing protein [Trichonephila clavipes]